MASAPPLDPPVQEPTAFSSLDFYRLSVDQYHRMTQAGILTHEDRVELLEGALVRKMTKNTPHVVATNLLQAALVRSLPAGWFMSMQNPFTTGDSEPEPDACVVRGDPRDSMARHAGPNDVALEVEVADTSLIEDQRIKLRIYARAGVRVYWIVNLATRRLEVYSDPNGSIEPPSYRTKAELGPDDEVSLIIDGHEAARIAVRDLLP